MAKPIFPDPDRPRPGMDGGPSRLSLVVLGLHHGMRPDTYVGYDLVVSCEDTVHRKPMRGYEGGLIHIPMKDDTDQLIDSVMVNVAANAIQRVIANGGKVLVHCEGGINRSSVVVAAYLIRCGLTGQEAVDMIRRCRDSYCLCNETFLRWVLMHDHGAAA